MRSLKSASNLVSKLTDSEKKALMKEIGRICEKQYRKGYQHGVYDFADNLVDKKAADKFRMNGSTENYSRVMYPPHMKRKVDPLERVKCELAMSNVDILNELFSNLPKY